MGTMIDFMVGAVGGVLMRFLFIILLLPFPTYGAERVFSVDKPLKTIAYDLIGTLEQQEEDGIYNIRQILLLLRRYERYLFEPDLKIEMGGYPKRHYYYSNIELLKPYSALSCFKRKCELWAKDGKTICKLRINFNTTINFRIRWIERIKNKVLCRIENRITDMEVQRLLKLANTKPTLSKEEEIEREVATRQQVWDRFVNGLTDVIITVPMLLELRDEDKGSETTSQVSNEKEG